MIEEQHDDVDIPAMVLDGGGNQLAYTYNGALVMHQTGTQQVQMLEGPGGMFLLPRKTSEFQFSAGKREKRVFRGRALPAGGTCPGCGLMLVREEPACPRCGVPQILSVAAFDPTPGS